MVCCKCHRVHPRFKNGKFKKTCPTRKGKKTRVKKRGKMAKARPRRQKGKGKLTDELKRMAVSYAKKKGKEYLVKKGLLKDPNKKKAPRTGPKWANAREKQAEPKFVKW